jgi:hypothetical protein
MLKNRLNLGPLYIYNTYIHMICYLFISVKGFKCIFVYIYRRFLMPFFLNENDNNIYIGYAPDDLYTLKVFF